MHTKRSHDLFVHAQELIPGGVNSPVRACRNVHADPLFIADAKGSHLTTADGDDVIDGFVGNHGGNMDNKLIGAGARLYFPVRVPGALLQMGDVHAAMGDAELCGTGIEIPAEITVRIQLVKGFELHWPVLETADKWYVNANAQEYNEALVNASKEMQRLLMAVSGWDAVETYMYLSVAGDVEINQGCKPCEVQLSLRLGIPKLAEFPALLPSPGQSR